MAKKGKNKRRKILAAKIDFLSLCPRGANQISTVYKADGDAEEKVSLNTLIKGDMSEQGELLAVVYAPDYVDSQGDSASAQVIKEMAYGYSQNGGGIDIRHDEQKLSKDDIFVAQSFIIQKNDPRFEDTKDYDGNSVDVSGGWGVIIKVNSETLRKSYRDEQWQGISMGGMSISVPDEDNEAKGIVKSIEQLIKSITRSNKDLENEMTKEEKAELKKELAKELTPAVAKAVLEDINKSKDKKDKEGSSKGMGYIKPVLKANPSDEDISNHEKNVQIYELSKAVDTNDLDSIHKFNQLKKAIIDGKEVEISSTRKNQPFDAFLTNQESHDVSRKVSGSKDEYADSILKEMDAEDEKK